MPERSPVIHAGAGRALFVAAAEGEELPGGNRAGCYKTTKRRSNRVDEEEDFLFVAMEEAQSENVASTKATVSHWRREARHGMLGLLMASMTLGLALGGCYIIFNLGASHPAPMLAYTFSIALWYFVVYTVAWSLLGKIYQVFASSTRQEAALFVDEVADHSTLWYWVCLIVAVFCCGIAALQVMRGEVLWSKTIVLEVAWAFVNTAVGWCMVLVAADALGVAGYRIVSMILLQQAHERPARESARL